MTGDCRFVQYTSMMILKQVFQILLATRAAASLLLYGNIDRGCVQSVMVCGSDTLRMNGKYTQRLERTQSMLQ